MTYLHYKSTLSASLRMVVGLGYHWKPSHNHIITYRLFSELMEGIVVNLVFLTMLQKTVQAVVGYSKLVGNEKIKNAKRIVLIV